VGKESQAIESEIRGFYRFLSHTVCGGITEVRLIRPEGGVDGIGFFADEDAFVRACADASGKVNVYAGVQPRPGRLLPGAENAVGKIKSGVCDRQIEIVSNIVIDLDPVRPPRVSSTDDELGQAVAVATYAAAWYEMRGFVRPIRVVSGNGCHLWFAIPPITVTDANRDEITERLKLFEDRFRRRFAVGTVNVDAIQNLSRVIKVAGTLAMKGENTADRPHRPAFGLDPFVRHEDAKLRDALLAAPLPQPPARGPEPEVAEIAVRDRLSTMTMALLHTKPSLAALYNGTGKQSVGLDGGSLDTTTSGYDYTVVAELIHHGITDPTELATALWLRPGGRAQEKGLRYVSRTVTKALAQTQACLLASALQAGD